MSTASMMKWASDLRYIDPLEKLVAMYFAGSAGCAGESSGAMIISAHDLAEWCGCRKEDAVVALITLRSYGLDSREDEPWLFHTFLQLDPRDNRPLHWGPIVEARRFLYVVSTPSGVKIGITDKPEQRFKSLRSGSPETLKVHLAAEGPRRIVEWAETRCHQDLVLHHIRGEWFSCSPITAVSVARAVLEEGGIILS